jgi:hypothetical protein
MQRFVAEIQTRDGMVFVQVIRRGEPLSAPVASFSCRTGASGLGAFVQLTELVLGGLLNGVDKGT